MGTSRIIPGGLFFYFQETSTETSTETSMETSTETSMDSPGTSREYPTRIPMEPPGTSPTSPPGIVPGFPGRFHSILHMLSCAKEVSKNFLICPSTVSTISGPENFSFFRPVSPFSSHRNLPGNPRFSGDAPGYPTVLPEDTPACLPYPQYQVRENLPGNPAPSPSHSQDLPGAPGSPR